MGNVMKLKEIVVTAMVSVLIGAVFMGLDAIYQPLQAMAGPIGGDIIYGIYLLSALIPMYLVRKPGAAILGSLITGVVNLLLGSPYGIHIIVAAALQGAGVEIVMYMIKYKGINLVKLSLAAIVAMLFVTARDNFVFGLSFYGNLIPVMLIVRVVSSIVFGAALTMTIGAGLTKTGVVSDLNIAKS